jgi:hypothetical protein
MAACYRPDGATPGPVPAGAGWASEAKHDGVRATITAVDGRWRLRSRTGRDISGTFPDLSVLPDLLGGRRVALDGELVVLDAAGISDFSRLQQRIGVTNSSSRLLRTVPVTFCRCSTCGCGCAAAGGHAAVLRRCRRRAVCRSAGTRSGGHRLQTPDLALHAGPAEQGVGQDGFCRAAAGVRTGLQQLTSTSHPVCCPRHLLRRFPETSQSLWRTMSTVRTKWLWHKVRDHGLVGEDHAAAQEIEVRAAVHLTLDRFESADVAFHRAAAPGQGEPVADSVIVLD